jgi:hypothetical protein
MFKCNEKTLDSVPKWENGNLDVLGERDKWILLKDEKR